MGLGLGTFEIVLIIVVGIIGLFIAIKYGAIPEYMEEMEKRQKKKRDQEEEANSRKYISVKAHLTKHINKKVLLVPEEYQQEFMNHVNNQMGSDLPYDKSTWTIIDDIDMIYDHYFNKTSGNSEKVSRVDELNYLKEKRKESLQETRKRRKEIISN